jgi:hypothetical protein
MDGVIRFLNGPLGRAARAVLGVALLGYGILGIGGVGGAALAVVGLVPLALGAWGHCLLEPFSRPASPAN